MFNFFSKHKAPAPSNLTQQRMSDGQGELDVLWDEYDRIFEGLTPERIAQHALKTALKKRNSPSQMPGGVFPLALALAQDSGLFPTRDETANPNTTAERIRASVGRAHLQKLCENPQGALEEVIRTIELILTKLLWSLSDTSFEPGDGFQINVPTIQALDALPSLVEEITQIIHTSANRHPTLSLFNPFTTAWEANQKHIAGLAFNEDWGARRRPTLQSAQSQFANAEEAVTAFYRGTAFEEFLQSECPLSIPKELRKEHMLLMAPSGWGKTQTLQRFIQDDLEAVKRGERSIIVIESENQLAQQVARHPYFNRAAPGNIADRLYYVNPEQKGATPQLSFFDIADKPFSEMTEHEREENTNHIIDLYKYIFRALMEHELTAKQGLVFVKLVYMLSWVPGATMNTLMRCLEDAEEAYRLSSHAPENIQEYFHKHYDKPTFTGTREEIHQRLDMFRTQNGTFERMVAGERSNFHLRKLMDKGSVIVINTSKLHMGEDGSRALGRFMIALLRMATLSRSETSLPCMVYIDEAQEFLDEKCRSLFEQARKRAVGLTVAHQEITQIESGLRNLIIGSTALKFAGQGTKRDISYLKHNMKADDEIFMRLRKRNGVGSEFAFFGRDITKGGAVTVPMKFGAFNEVGKPGSLPRPRWLSLPSPKPASASTPQHRKKAPTPQPQKPNLTPWTK